MLLVLFTPELERVNFPYKKVDIYSLFFQSIKTSRRTQGKNNTHRYRRNYIHKSIVDNTTGKAKHFLYWTYLCKDLSYFCCSIWMILCNFSHNWCKMFTLNFNCNFSVIKFSGKLYKMQILYNFFTIFLVGGIFSSKDDISNQRVLS